VTLRRIGWPARACRGEDRLGHRRGSLRERCPGVINNFNALGERTKQDILNFLRSL